MAREAIVITTVPGVEIVATRQVRRRSNRNGRSGLHVFR